VNSERRKPWKLAGAAVLVTWSLTIIGAVWAASADRAAIGSRLESNTARLADHENRLRLLERQSAEIAADVKWIRKTLEQKTP